MTAAVGVQVNKMKGRKVEGEDLGDLVEMGTQKGRLRQASTAEMEVRLGRESSEDR